MPISTPHCFLVIYLTPFYSVTVTWCFLKLKWQFREMCGRGIVMKNLWWPLPLLAWKSLDHCWLGAFGVKFPCVWLIYIYRWFFCCDDPLVCQWWPKDVRQQQHTAWYVPDSIPRVPDTVYHAWHHIHIECQTPYISKSSWHHISRAWHRINNKCQTPYIYIECQTPYVWRVPVTVHIQCPESPLTQYNSLMWI